MILGIDEVGRGPWAGPLVIGAAILPDERPDWVKELRDSKKLSEKKREELNEIILKETAATGLGWVWQYEIDEMGMSEALKVATRRAIKAMKEKYAGAQFSEIIIDGTQNFLAGTVLEKRATVLTKGDDLIKEISAASIIAKVARDSYMKDLAEKYPQYAFEKHKGYGTQKHIAALKEFGVTPEHRLSLKPVRKIAGLPPLERKTADSKNTTEIGKRAEQEVAEFLTCEGHEIITQNYKNRISEIDIVSIKDDKIYFTEVRYRKDDKWGSGLESVDLAKRRQIEFAARVFLANRPEFKEFQPLLAVANVIGDNFEIQDWVVLSE